MSERLAKLVRKGIPVVTPLARDLYRLKGLVRYGVLPGARALRWWWGSREYTNYTYELTALSRSYLVHFLHNTLGTPLPDVERYLRELADDATLRGHLEERARATADRYFADLPFRYGRRAGWYVCVRSLKPRLVVESGIDRGLGTCVLGAAMLRNAQEGHPGKVVGMDINPRAGSYVGGPYEGVCSVRYGDSLETIRKLEEPVDLFIHDSDHSAEHERAEYDLVVDRLAPGAFLLSDNAEEEPALMEFAREHAWRFHYWQEVPKGHVHTGGGIGLATAGGRP